MSHENDEGTSSNSSSANPCPICLGSFVQESYLDQCFHKFCYNCILRWRKVVSGKSGRLPSSLKCPLCKTDNLSIIHGYDGSSFQRHYFSHDYGDSFSLSKAHKIRLQCYYTEPGTLNDVFNVSRFWKFRKYLQPNRWLYDWLRRELQALIQYSTPRQGYGWGLLLRYFNVKEEYCFRNKEQHQAMKPESKQGEFKALVSDSARPFLTERTERFVNELELFLASGLNIEAYDEVCMQQIASKNSGEGNGGMEEERNENVPLIPYLHIFDEDSDATD